MGPWASTEAWAVGSVERPNWTRKPAMARKSGTPEEKWPSRTSERKRAAPSGAQAGWTAMLMAPLVVMQQTSVAGPAGGVTTWLV